MRLPWIRIAFVVSLSSTALLARQGVVQTKDGNSFEGDVVPHDKAGTVDITAGQVTTTIRQANVQAILYPEDVAADVKKQLPRLAPNDAAGRVMLAQHAIDGRAYSAARDILLEAVKIDPKNADARGLLDDVERRVHLAAAGNAPATAPAAPTTAPALAENATHPVFENKITSTDPPAIRMVTPEELNYVRQLELNQSETGVRVRIDPDTRKQYLAYSGASITEFSAMSPVMQAFTILDAGKNLSKGVHILSDPASMNLFKREVNKTLVAGCATSGCHSGKPVGGLVFFPQVDNDAAVYSNFVILQRHNLTLKDRIGLMIDRQTPSDSLLLQLVLPPELADVPHPSKTHYKGAVRNRMDTRFRQIERWVNGTHFPGPDYSKIDLSKPPTTQPTDDRAQTR